MALIPSTQIPVAIECGDTLCAQISYGSYPASEWVATLTLNCPGIQPITAIAAVSGSSFLFTVGAAVTASMVPGIYYYAIRAVNGSSQTATAESGMITFLPNLYAAQAVSIAQQQLDALNASILALSAKRMTSVNFNGQSFTFQDLAKLQSVRRILVNEINSERAQEMAFRGRAPTRSIRPYFQ